MAVIGGGNAAIDSARTALRLGADVTVVYRRERKDMPAIAEETAAAELEGAKFLFLSAPHRILIDSSGAVRGLEIARTRLGAFDASGRRKPIPTGEIVRLDCENVLLATGETVDAQFCADSGAKLNESGMLAVDRFSHETSRKNVYAGGDLVNGPSNVTTAMGYGKEAARAIDQRLSGADRFEMLDGFIYDRTVPEKPSPSRRHHAHELPVSLRVHGAAEVIAGLGAAEAKEEASRCLRCDVCN
jgi:NADH-quinone oxidoreductase subunit F